MSFVIACRNYFGIKERQTLLEFSEELKQLTKKDREELAPLLSQVLGEEVTVE
jgi:hypothetical protein